MMHDQGSQVLPYDSAAMLSPLVVSMYGMLRDPQITDTADAFHS